MKDELEELKKQERFHSRLYYQESNPQISDEEYDNLRKKIRKIQEIIPFLQGKSGSTREELYRKIQEIIPLQGKSHTAHDFREGEGDEEVGFLDASTPFRKYKHLPPMLSLENAFLWEDVEMWIERLNRSLAGEVFGRDYSLFGEVKIDGVSLALRYEDGRLKRALTRGDGFEGEDVTHNLRHIENIPEVVDSDVEEIRGEAYITFENFESINSRLEKPFSTPRNLASGTLRQIHKGDKDVEIRNLNFAAFDLIGPDLSSREEMVEKLASLGFCTPRHALLRSMEEVQRFYGETLEMRGKIPYQIDGVVYKVCTASLCRILGANNHHPRWAIAHKMPSPRSSTLLRDVVWQVGREGVITPVAILDEVNLGGTNVTRASLHNFSYIQEKGIGKMHKVEVERAGDVIPQVIRSIEPLRQASPVQMPSSCPSCESQLVYVKPHLRCHNSLCKARKIAKLAHFVSKGGLDIGNLGLKTLELLFAKGIVHEPSDIFKLQYEDLRGLEGFQDKSIQNLLNSVETARSVLFSKFLFALGIPQCGSENCRLIAQKYSAEDFLSGKLEGLESLNNIGPKTAAEIKAFVNAHRDEMQEQASHLKIRQDEARRNRGVVVFTGKLSAPRSAFKMEAEAKGFEVAGQVSSKTNWVVVGEAPGKKLEVAQSAGVKILKEGEWKDFIRKRYDG